MTTTPDRLEEIRARALCPKCGQEMFSCGRPKSGREIFYCEADTCGTAYAPDNIESIKARLEAGRHKARPGRGLNTFPVPTQEQIARMTLLAQFEGDMDILIAHLEASEAEVKRLREGWAPSDEFEVTGTSRNVRTQALTGITVHDPETKDFVGFVCIDRYYEREQRALTAEAEVERLRRVIAMHKEADAIEHVAPARGQHEGQE